MSVKPLLALLFLARVAHAEPEPAHSVALLPLDADAKLELYGQPVASELARALVQGGLDVLVVGPKMAVPEKARLVVDGTIKAGRGDTVTLTARIRDSRDGTIYDTLVVTAASLTGIDRAEEELSAKVLPSVRGRLATLIEADNAAHAGKPPDPKPAVVKPAAPAALAVMLASFHADANAGASGEALRAALALAFVPWASHRHHDVHVVDQYVLAGKIAQAVVAQRAELAMTLDVLAIELVQADLAPIPTARARVRVRISDPEGIVFDRVIHTDTIVGEKGVGENGVGEKGVDQPALIARVAREILSIADPQVRRRIPSWF